MQLNVDTSDVAVRMTLAQRKLAAELVSQLADRVLLDCRNQRTLSLSMVEAVQLRRQAELTIQHAESGAKRNSFRHIVEAVNRGIEQRITKSISASGVVFHFKLTLSESEPPIWRPSRFGTLRLTTCTSISKPPWGGPIRISISS